MAIITKLRSAYQNARRADAEQMARLADESSRLDLVGARLGQWVKQLIGTIAGPFDSIGLALGGRRALGVVGGFTGLAGGLGLLYAWRNGMLPVVQ